MVSRVKSGDFASAASYFSSLAKGNYQQAFLSLGTASTVFSIEQIGRLTVDYISGDEAECYFQQNIDGQTITFPVEFVKENGSMAGVRP